MSAEPTFEPLPEEKPCPHCGGTYTAANVELAYLHTLSERERENYELRTEVERLRAELAARPAR